ncbi:MAG TPA: hypothetical protein VMV52_03635 [Candidatus Nanopelagicaceae bacterium]|nr:hypothetical protein [Candidatus Nanopelagicaceae bacterium]
MDSKFDADLVNDPIFDGLRRFAELSSSPNSVPVHLLRQYTAGQRRAQGRRKWRLGSGALFGVIILLPSLAYAGVLPNSVARAVQKVFNVISVPIQIPSVTKTDGSPSKNPVETGGSAPTGSVQVPDQGLSQSEDGTSLLSPGQNSNDGNPESPESSSPKPLPESPESSSPKPLLGSVSGSISVDGSDGSDDAGSKLTGQSSTGLGATVGEPGTDNPEPSPSDSLSGIISGSSEGD